MRNLENRVAVILNDVERRLLNLEERVGKIPDPFMLYYKAPTDERHQKITDVLDDVHTRLNILEDMLSQNL